MSSLQSPGRSQYSLKLSRMTKSSAAMNIGPSSVSVGEITQQHWLVKRRRYIHLLFEVTKHIIHHIAHIRKNRWFHVERFYFPRSFKVSNNLGKKKVLAPRGCSSSIYIWRVDGHLPVNFFYEEQITRSICSSLVLLEGLRGVFKIFITDSMMLPVNLLLDRCCPEG